MTDEELADFKNWVGRALKAEGELAACKAKLALLRVAAEAMVDSSPSGNQWSALLDALEAIR